MLSNGPKLPATRDAFGRGHSIPYGRKLAGSYYQRIRKNGKASQKGHHPMITPEAMRELADRLDIYPNHPIDATSKAAAAMLRSIAAEREWRSMDSAPKDGKHCILSVPSAGGFIYSVQGAFQGGQWNAVHSDNVKPIAWMPNRLLPDELRQLTKGAE